jgi:hypothetical protein
MCSAVHALAEFGDGVRWESETKEDWRHGMWQEDGEDRPEKDCEEDGKEDDKEGREEVARPDPNPTGAVAGRRSGNGVAHEFGVSPPPARSVGVLGFARLSRPARPPSLFIAPAGEENRAESPVFIFSESRGRRSGDLPPGSTHSRRPGARNPARL